MIKTVSIDNLNECTAQEVFDFVAKHLLTQKERSARFSDCFYRMYKQGDRQLSCAAGCLIPEEKYSRKMEGQGWLSLMSSNIVPTEHHRLIASLQTLHDKYDVLHWKEQLEKLSKVYALDFKEALYVDGN